MPHYPKPFFRVKRGLWCVQIAGRQINLGLDRDEAFRHYHGLMARDRDEPEPSSGDSVISVLDAFLDWCQKHRARRTYDRYRDYFQPFARSTPRDLPVERLGQRQAGRDYGRPAGVQLGGEDGAD